jgi:hypothetical protein
MAGLAAALRRSIHVVRRRSSRGKDGETREEGVGLNGKVLREAEAILEGVITGGYSVTGVINARKKKTPR